MDGGNYSVQYYPDRGNKLFTIYTPVAEQSIGNFRGDLRGVRDYSGVDFHAQDLISVEFSFGFVLNFWYVNFGSPAV